jgi:WhiB family transcriptional regulator, redox-sensing transcriptional regulator
MVRAAQLPGPVADLWDWQLEAACRQVNPELFFNPEGERGSERRSRGSQAIAVCSGCPVLQYCRDHALQTREPYGVWGGMTEDQRWAYLSARDN